MTDDLDRAGPGGHFRTLAPWEHERLRSHLKRLSSSDRHRRFNGTLTDGAVNDYARRVLVSGSVKVIGWFERGALRAIGELSWNREGEAEAAFSVEPGYRRRGVGKALAKRLQRAARNRGIRAITVYTEAGNAPMRHLASHLGARLRIVDGDATGEAPVANADAFSFWGELAEEETGFLVDAGRTWARFWRGLGVRTLAWVRNPLAAGRQFR